MNEDPTPDSKPSDLPQPGEPRNQEILEPVKARTGRSSEPELLSRLLDIEKERIASADKRTEVMRLAIEASTASDTRQFDFQMERLRLSEEGAKRKDRLARYFVIGTLVAGGLLIAVLLAIGFYGNDRQSTIALQILYAIFTGIGGYGVFNTLRRITKRLMDQSSTEDDS